jgi:CRISPR-associated endonuclease/helicase Cas3
MSMKWAESFNSGDWAWNAGWLHDLGKASEAFQRYLESSSLFHGSEKAISDPDYDTLSRVGRVNHSAAGAAYAECVFSGPISRVLAYLCAGHHAGLADYASEATRLASLPARIMEGRILLKAVNAGIDEIDTNLKNAITPPAFVGMDNFHLWVRMLFSCLVDADRLDTERFCDPIKASRRGCFGSLASLKKEFDDYVGTLCLRKPEKPVNRIRKEVLDWSREAAKQPSGLFSLNVPTGGGKTLSSLAFAIDHALINNKQRIIYVIPYTTIIEQTASILRDISSEWERNVIEHHSNFNPKRNTLEADLAAENWDAPIVITTNVQFFESLFSARASDCRKLHNIIDSIVIFDEAQLIPAEKLAPCVHAMNELRRNYGVTLLLSTATQPPLPGLEKSYEIVPNPASLHERLKRVSVSFSNDDNSATDSRVCWSSIASDIACHKQVLCIVNSRRDCYDLWSKLREVVPSGDEPFHLSTLLCGAHRSCVITEVKNRLSAGESVRVVSTQLVEAGVDIDFPIVYRALAGLDSIAQAAGRCNREGNLSEEGGFGEVRVFMPPKQAPRGLLRKGEDTIKEIASLPAFDPLEPEWFKRYFSLFYSRLSDTGTRFLRALTPSCPQELDVAFRTVGNEFRLIDEVSKSVLVSYDEGLELINLMRNSGPNRELLRKLQRYTVSLQQWVVDKHAHNLIEVWDGFFAWNGPSNKSIDVDIFKDTYSSEELVL